MAVCVSVARVALLGAALVAAVAASPAQARGRQHHHGRYGRQTFSAAPKVPQGGHGWSQAAAWQSEHGQSWGDPTGTWGGAAGWSHEARAERSDAAGESAHEEGGLKALVARHARENGIPVALADAVVRIESGYNPHARNRSGAMGLMQIKAQTARGQGYSGGASGLLNPETNLRYAMRYLATAYRMAGGDICGTVMRYQSGHYARHMSGADRSYCSKARRLMAQI